MPGKKMKSIKNPKQYEKLRDMGYSKGSAAAMSNSSYNKGHKRKGRKKR